MREVQEERGARVVEGEEVVEVGVGDVDEDEHVCRHGYARHDYEGLDARLLQKKDTQIYEHAQLMILT
jgi:hypothetical protein